MRLKSSLNLVHVEVFQTGIINKYPPSNVEGFLGYRA
jgi:hypothetical protein